MKLLKQTYIVPAVILIMSSIGYGFHFDINKNSTFLDTYSEKIRGDSIAVAQVLDSAQIAFELKQFDDAIAYAKKSYDLSKNYPNEDYTIESMLLLARAYKNIHLSEGSESAFNGALKFYLKIIATLESSNRRNQLSQIYIEYGDFYAALRLPKLTVENYEKALEIIKNEPDSELKKRLISKIALLHLELNDLKEAISFYYDLAQLFERQNQKDQYIETIQTLSSLYRKNGDFDNALSKAKVVLNYYKTKNDIEKQITYLNLIGVLSYESMNNSQAKNSFVEYFELLKKYPEQFDLEVQSLRYIKTMITVGKIYKWSTDNGYLSNYELAIRHFNTAQKYTDFNKNPGLASEILNLTGKIYYNKEDYKTCITYFDLALFYAKRSDDLEAISENHIMLARAFDEISRWEEASKHYELHATYKDSLFQKNEKQRQLMNEVILSQRTDNLKVEETLDRIETRERQELTLAEKELLNVTLERELEIYKRESELKEAILKNQKLAEDSVKRNLLLAVQRYENVKNQQQIENLNSEREIQEQRLKNQEADQENKRQRIKILEQENSLAKSRQAYYVLSIFLISLVLIFIIVVYIQKRRANTVLRAQNEKIEHQSVKLKEAYQNLELLSTIGRDITASLIIEEIIETVYANLNTLMDASVLGIGVYDRQKNLLHFPGVIERNKRQQNINIDLTNENTLAVACFLNQQEIMIDNYYQEYNQFILPADKPFPGDGNSTSIIYVPLTIGSKKLGVLTVQSFSENAFNDYHINIIRNIAVHTKIALENANFYKELEEKSNSLTHANRNIKVQNKLIEEQNQELMSINEEKNNLMRILAHDLRNPLATAMSMTELVRFEKGNLSAEQYQASEIIWRGLKRMNEMIRKILDIKAVESQKVLLEYDQVNVNEIIPLLENSFNSEAEQKLINLHLISEEPDLFIRVDRHYFNQIIENLVSNAIKFSPSRTNIFVTIAEREDHVRIMVKDEGPGIPTNEMSQLFRKYHKLSTKPTAGEQSIGLGLSIVKKYVEVMNGQVWCESQVGIGTKFIVEFKKEALPVS